MTNSTRKTPRIILASGSPRRRDLLARLGLPLSVVNSCVDETLDGSRAIADAVVRLALDKAEAVARGLDHGVVIGADTVVVCDGRVLGKPENPADAVRMLRLLRNRWHEVYTGVAVLDAATMRAVSTSVESRVRMRAYGEDEIDAYVATGEPLDRAGSYAVQELGGKLVAEVDGCFNNVVGLPLCELAGLVSRFVAIPSTGVPVCALPNGAPCPRLS